MPAPLALEAGVMKCSNPECDFLPHSDTQKMGSFCCKKCHQHFCATKKSKPPQHGKQCEKKPAPSGAHCADVVAPDQPMEILNGSGSSRPSKEPAESKPHDVRPKGVWNEASKSSAPSVPRRMARSPNLRSASEDGEVVSHRRDSRHQRCRPNTRHDGDTPDLPATMVPGPGAERGATTDADMRSATSGHALPNRPALAGSADEADAAIPPRSRSRSRRLMGTWSRKRRSPKPNNSLPASGATCGRSSAFAASTPEADGSIAACGLFGISYREIERLFYEPETTLESDDATDTSSESPAVFVCFEEQSDEESEKPGETRRGANPEPAPVLAPRRREDEHAEHAVLALPAPAPACGVPDGNGT
mmetsp:Transcript_31987/g.71890  ORF Transcript_31987/g.71890 Transcript_31987/m.71890 type:complete len:362 (+) Transcript_31987:31-1116(+)